MSGAVMVRFWPPVVAVMSMPEEPSVSEEPGTAPAAVMVIGPPGFAMRSPPSVRLPPIETLTFGAVTVASHTPTSVGFGSTPPTQLEAWLSGVVLSAFVAVWAWTSDLWNQPLPKQSVKRNTRRDLKRRNRDAALVRSDRCI